MRCALPGLVLGCCGARAGGPDAGNGILASPGSGGDRRMGTSTPAALPCSGIIWPDKWRWRPTPLLGQAVPTSDGEVP
ncbi:hypothetical protein NDU88_002984 [Pleurodeles waltl]|uniref:Secreted protein n=1 Tax=Pleurodeles waltl TaxID=8319 RepID=A0AAV7RDQ5_PLEWA|nr:hypothetical protein NDU88_002984 [Pleurodeles waltl]